VGTCNVKLIWELGSCKSLEVTRVWLYRKFFLGKSKVKRVCAYPPYAQESVKNR